MEQCVDMNITVLECGKCKKRFREVMLMPMAAGAAVARMQAFNVCPYCEHKGAYIIDSEYETLKESVYQEFYRFSQLFAAPTTLKPAFCMDCRVLTIAPDQHKDHFLVHSFEEFEANFSKYVFKNLK
jgi:hypothetical protein